MNTTDLQLLENLGDAALILAPDGFIQHYNTSLLKLTELPAEEFEGKFFSTVYEEPNDRIRAEYELAQALKNHRFISEGWRRKNGGRYWGEMVLTEMKDASGQTSGVLCTLRDVTPRMQHVVSLRQSEERFRLMVEGVKDYAIFLLDPKGYVLTWNEGAKRAKGYSANEIIGRHFSTFYTREDLDIEKPKHELEVAIATGKYEEEGWRVRKNGSVFWANIMLTALWNTQNQLIGFSKVTRDLTDRKENEENLRQSEERYRSLVEQVTDYGIFMMDEKGCIISWNEGAKKIKGYQPHEIIGKYFSIFYPEEDILTGKPPRELAIARAEGKYEEEGWRLRKDGSRFWANVVITAIYDKNGFHIGYSKVTRDLTERKEGERALRESYDRYRKLAEELKTTNHELSEANQELEQFTSIVSHDLQEPIRTIKSFLQLIDMKLNEGQHEDLNAYIQKSINAANRMRELIHNLLHYSQLSKGEVMLAEIDVNELIQEALQNLKLAIDTSNAVISLDTQVKTVMGDRIQLVQLLQNLIGNALKFTNREQPRIVVACRLENGKAVFSVKDNGIGIADADKHKVFDIFRRLHTSKDYPGTGIGLAICKKIVDRHSGELWVDSKPGEGTTFHFSLQNA